MQFRCNRLKVLLLLVALSFGGAALAGTTGKIAGRVLDAESGAPLPYANVILVGQNQGAATDDEGRFFILNVRPGTYTVRADYVGYSSRTVTGVRVTIDHTSRLRLELSPQVIELEDGGAVVVADRVLFQKDLTASQAVVGRDDIDDTPATELGDLLELQAGITTDAGGGIHFRGGRSGEVAFMVDGVSFTDVFTGGQSVAVENASIEEVQVLSGAFNAEYGQAMSGVVNIVTKEGASEWNGSLSGYGGDFLSTHDDLFWGIDDLAPDAIRDLQATLSGPLVAGKLSLFASARATGSDGYLYGRRVFNYYDVADFTPLEESDWRMLPTGDSSFVAMNGYRKYSGQAKLTYRPSTRLTCRYNVLLENSKNDNFDSYFRYNPDGTPSYRKTGQSHTLTATWTVDSAGRSFVDLGFSWFDNHQESWVFEDRNDPRYYFTDYLTHIPPYGYSFATGGVAPNWWEQQTQTRVLKGAFTSQVNNENLVKAGLEWRAHDLDTYNQTVFQGRVGDPLIEQFKVSPSDFSAYLQDKLEVADLVLNIGLRLDRFAPNAVIPFDPRDPNVESPLRSFFDHSSGRIYGFDDQGAPVYQDSVYTIPWDDPGATEWRRPYMYKPATVKYQVSPRIGLSYPITDTGGIHVSYGHFFQMPTLSTIYSNPQWRMGDGVGITALMGNPDIDAQKTVQYEIGIQQQIGESGRLTTDFFFRDFRNLLASDRIVETYSAGKKYTQYNNRDQGNARGIALSYSEDRAGYFWSVDYTFQIAEGVASDPATAFRRLSSGLEPLPQLVPLNWDRRHNLNLRGGLNREHWGGSILANIWSPTPYTPSEVHPGAVVENIGRIPAFYNVDLQAHYNWLVRSRKVEFFLRIFNLLDRENELFVYSDTGRATESLAEIRARELSTEYVNSVDAFFDNPSLFSSPRQVQVGFNLNF